MNQPSTPVTLSNINIPFGRLVIIMLKWMLAAIPALILFYIVILTLGVCRTEFIVWAMSLASASRAAQWRGGSLAKMREAG